MIRLIMFYILFSVVHALCQPCGDYQCDSIELRKLYISFGQDSTTIDLSGEFKDKKRVETIAWSLAIDSLPDGICNLTALKSLTISGKKIRYLPSSIGNLTNLEYLDLSDNQLDELPEEISNLKNLKRLDIQGNNLRRLPDSIVNLQNLEPVIDVGNAYYCYFRNNYLCNLPDAVAQWLDTYDYGWYNDQKEPCNRSGVIITPEIKGADISGDRHNEPKYLYTLRGTRIGNAKGISGVKSMPPGCYIITAGEQGRYRNMHVEMR